MFSGPGLGMAGFQNLNKRSELSISSREQSTQAKFVEGTLHMEMQTMHLKVFITRTT